MSLNKNTIMRVALVAAVIGSYASLRTYTKHVTVNELREVTTARGTQQALDTAIAWYLQQDCVRDYGFGRVYLPGHCEGIDAWLTANGLRMSAPIPPALEPVLGR